MVAKHDLIKLTVNKILYLGAVKIMHGKYKMIEDLVFKTEPVQNTGCIIVHSSANSKKEIYKAY